MVIVRPAGESQRLITQPDHAALARRIMDGWVADGWPSHPRRDVIALAIEQHDNGWRELDAAPIRDPTSGTVADFVSAPVEARRAVWPRGLSRLSDHSWAAALVAQHALHVYRRFRGDAEWRAFFAALTGLRDRFAAAAGLTDADLAGDYRFLEVADFVSLTFCNGWTETQHLDGYSACVDDGDTLVIAPDPFGGATVPLSVPARAIPNRRFEDDEGLADVWRRAETLMVRGTARGRGQTGVKPQV